MPSNTSRPSLDEYFVQMLKMVASRSTCRRRNVGAIITTQKGTILSTGYNGVPSGVNHCIQWPCAGALDPSGDSSRCWAVHAEQNALLQCSNIFRAHTIYCSTFPCFGCAKMIANTGIRRVVYVEDYPDMSMSAELFTFKQIDHWKFIAQV